MRTRRTPVVEEARRGTGKPWRVEHDHLGPRAIPPRPQFSRSADNDERYDPDGILGRSRMTSRPSLTSHTPDRLHRW